MTEIVVAKTYYELIIGPQKRIYDVYNLGIKLKPICDFAEHTARQSSQGCSVQSREQMREGETEKG